MDGNNTPTPPELSQTWKGIAFAILVGLSFAGGRFSVKPSGPQNRDPLQDQVRKDLKARGQWPEPTPNPGASSASSTEALKAALESLEKAKLDIEQQMGLPPGELDKRAKEREERIPEPK